MQGQTLAQMVRAKFPGAYDDLSDQQLESSVKAKYPGVYDDLPLSSAKAREQTPAPKPGWFQDAGGGGYRGPTGHATSVPTDVALDRLRSSAPAIGATVGALAGPVGAGFGGALGQAVKDAPNSFATVGDRVLHAAKTGVIEGATQGALGWVASKAPALEETALSWWKGLAKIPDRVAKNTQAARVTGSLDKGGDEIARTVLDRGRGTIRQKNADALESSIDALDEKLKSIFSSGQTDARGFIDRKPIREALTKERNAIVPGVPGASAERAVFDAAIKDLRKLPPKMTAAMAQQAKVQTYQRFRNAYKAGVEDNALATAGKQVAHGLKDQIDTLAPEAMPVNAELSKLYPAAESMQAALKRTGNHSPINFTTLMTGMVTKPATIAAALANHPKIGSFTAQQIYNAAKLLPQNARTAANIIRLAEGLTNMALTPSHGPEK